MRSMAPPLGALSAAPLQCALKVLGYGGPGRPPPHAQIGRPGGLLVLFAQSKSTCRGCFYPARNLSMGSASCVTVLTIFPLHAAEVSPLRRRPQPQSSRPEATRLRLPFLLLSERETVLQFIHTNSGAFCYNEYAVNTPPFGVVCTLPGGNDDRIKTCVQALWRYRSRP